TITSISPTTGTVCGGTPITITGLNFQDGATVIIDDAAPITVTGGQVVEGTVIYATTNAGTVEAAGSDVIVSNPGGAGSDTLDNGYMYSADELSVSVDRDTVALGPVTAGTTIVSPVGEVVVVTNDSVCSTTTLRLRILADPAEWTSSITAQGMETYVLYAEFNSGQPGVGTFTKPNHGLTNADQDASGTKFAGDQTGQNVPASETRNLWFRFDAPTVTIRSAQGTITVRLTAISP
ncbi:unnamed protein product, partial [marine sediment metagenome]